MASVIVSSDASTGLAKTRSRPVSSLPRDLVSTGTAAAMLGCSIMTIHRMCQRGELESFTYGSGHIRLSRKALRIYLGEDEAELRKEKSYVILYCRVSTSAQSSTKGKKDETDSDLARQIARLKKIAKERYGDRELVVLSDTRSGMSFLRPGLNKLIEGALSGQYKNAVVICSNRDRMARFGIDLIEKVLAYANITVEYVEQVSQDDQQILCEDLAACVFIFGARMHGKRSAARRRRQLSEELIQRATNLVNQKVSLQRITETLEREGYVDQDNKPITAATIRNNIMRPLLRLQKRVPIVEGMTSPQRYILEQTEKAPSNHRVDFSKMFAHYEEWARKNGIDPVGKKTFAQGFKAYRKANIGSGNRGVCVVGLIVKRRKLHVVVKETTNSRAVNLTEKLKKFCLDNGLSHKAAKRELEIENNGESILVGV